MNTLVIESIGHVDIDRIQQHEPEAKHISVQECEDDNTLVIESTGRADIDHIQQEHEPEGNRIMNFAFFNKELHRVFDNHSQYHCRFEDWKLVNTGRIEFKTQFFYECKFCFHKADFWSHPTDSTNMDLNTAITAGTITTGIGYAQMEEIFAAANVPCMSEKTYIQHRNIVVEEFEKTAIENMKIARKLEKQLAIERNEIINNHPYIIVVADDSWTKRSYGRDL